MAGERTDWRNLLPYCHRYLQESWFFGAEKDLRVPTHWAKPDPQNRPDSDDWRIHLDEAVRLEGKKGRFEEHFVMGDRSLYRLTVYYWEISIEGEQPEPGAIGVEIGQHRTRAKYTNDGKIYIGSEVLLQTEPYGAGDVVGCCFMYPNRVSFTKNSGFVGSLNIPLRPISWPLQWLMIVPGRCVGTSVYTNFGQSPFSFDIENHCTTSFFQTRDLASTLPMDVLELIIAEILASVTDDTWQIRHTKRLSRVCRRWNAICSLAIADRIEIRSTDDILRIMDLESSLAPQGLRTIEVEGGIILHYTMMLRLRPQLASVVYWWALSIMARTTDTLPPNASLGLPALLRATFPRLRTLKLHECAFRRWIDFARFVTALETLDELSVCLVVWEDRDRLIPPPSWLRIPQRLARLHFGGYPNYWNLPGYLWLFLAGRLSTAKRNSVPHRRDLTLTRQDCQLIVHICLSILGCNIDMIECELMKPGIILLRFSDRRITKLEMRFQDLQLSNYSLVDIYIVWDRHRTDLPRSISSPLARLTNAHACTCNFDLTRRRDRYLPRQHVQHPLSLQVVEALRQHIRLEMRTQHEAGLLRFIHDDTSAAESRSDLSSESTEALK